MPIRMCCTDVHSDCAVVLILIAWCLCSNTCCGCNLCDRRRHRCHRCATACHSYYSWTAASRCRSHPACSLRCRRWLSTSGHGCRRPLRPRIGCRRPLRPRIGCRRPTKAWIGCRRPCRAATNHRVCGIGTCSSRPCCNSAGLRLWHNSAAGCSPVLLWLAQLQRRARRCRMNSRTNKRCGRRRRYCGCAPICIASDRTGQCRLYIGHSRPIPRRVGPERSLGRLVERSGPRPRNCSAMPHRPIRARLRRVDGVAAWFLRVRRSSRQGSWSRR